MKVINRYIPYFYFTVALLMLINSIQKYLGEATQYKIIFSWNTDSKVTFIVVRIVLVFFVILAGIMRLRRGRQDRNL